MGESDARSWDEYRMLVERYMQDSSRQTEKIMERLTHLENTLSTMQGKNAIISGICGLIGGALLSYIFAHFK